MKTRVVDIGTTTDDQPVEQLAVERDGTEEGSKVSEGIDARILNLLDRVEERLGQEDKVTGTAITTHTEQIKKLTEVVIGHGKVLESLLRAQGTASHVAVDAGNDEGKNVNRRSCAVQKSELPAATKSRGRSKKKNTKEQDTLSIRAKGKKHGAAAVKTRNSSIPPLKRKLDFEDDDDDGCRIEIMQQGHGTPFTYGTNMSMYMESADMPSCLDLLFRPPLGMEFVGSELAVAAYIFGTGLSKKEILIPDEHCSGSRGVLHSLLPGEEVVDDVMNLVASMMTNSYLNEIGKRWWLPTTFAQFALNPTNHCPETLAFIKSKYMKKTNELVKIYVPLNKDRHWYLVVIDLLNEELIYLDSAKAESVTERKARFDQIRYVAFFLENMFRDGNLFEDNETAARPAPRMSDYYFVEPETGQQDPNSKDCGVWVAQWMMQAHVWGDYNLQVVNNATRMRLAVDLVMGRHNGKRNEVTRMAEEDWDRKMRRSAKKDSKTFGDPPSPSVSF